MPMRIRPAIIALYFLLAFGMAACSLRSPLAGEPLPGAAENLPPTGPAPEIVIQPSQKAPPAPSATAVQPGVSLGATPTPYDPSLLPVSSCDQITILADSTVPDGTRMEPGEVFAKAWKVQNSGTCDWSPAYRLALYEGDALGAARSVVPFFTSPDSDYELIIGSWPPRRFGIRPGETVDLVLLLQAPTETGSYTGLWSLVNDQGERVDPLFWVSIHVSGAPGDEDASPWHGAWGMNDPYAAERDITVYLYQQQDALTGVFYDMGGEMNLITGWIGKQPLLVKGEYGSPAQPVGNAFTWSLLRKGGDQISGVNHLDRFTDEPWCGSRPGKPLPETCLYDDKEDQ